MRFDRLGASLGLAMLVVLFQPTIFSQEEFGDDTADTPPVNGMFDENELEPLDEEEVVRPQPGQPTGRSIAPDEPEDMDRDEPVTPIRRPDRFTRPSSPSFPSRSPTSSPSGTTPLTLDFAKDVPNPNEKLRMDFVQVDIDEVVKYFAERLRKKFIYDPSILSGKITIISPTDVTVAEAWQAFLSAMEIRGYVVYPSGAYLKIDKVTNARKSPVPLFMQSTPEDDSYVTRIITLKFLNVSDIRQAVRDLVSRSGGDVIEHAPTNTLIISDYAANIRRIVRILNVLDVEGFQEQIAVVNLQYASASEVARKINEIFPTGGSSAQSRTTSRRTVRGRSVGSSADQSVIQKVVADDRTNSLIILGSERGIEQVRKFIDQIDIPIEGGDGQIHVYPLQNVKAEDIAQTLASLTQGGRSTTPTTPSTRNRPATTAPAAPTTTAANLFDGDVRITADPRTNSLVIQSSPRDFETLKGIIQKLDIRRRQVFIESVILETTVGGLSEWKSQVTGPFARTDKLGSSEDNKKSTGVFGTGNFGSGDELLGTLGGLLGTSAITGLALGFQSGSNVSITTPKAGGGTETVSVPLLSAILRLAATNRNLNVLSTPHILATANEEATISIGEEIPQIASTQESSGGNPISTFNRIRVATELIITPQINAGDYLTLNIKQKVNQRGAEILSGQFSVNTREANTTAIVKDGQTIVIGGIMRDETTVSTTKVPFLGDIPVLGWLFKSRRSENTKVNLLLFLTPHIIRDTADSNDVFFQKLRQRHNFLKDVGMKEKENLPVSGLKPEQLELLDEEYIKSLELRALPDRLPEELANPDGIAPAPSDAKAPTSPSESKPAPREPVYIPIMPPSGSGDSGHSNDDEYIEVESSEDREQREATPTPEPAPVPAPESQESEESQRAPEPGQTEPLNQDLAPPQDLPALEELDLPPLEDF